MSGHNVRALSPRAAVMALVTLALLLLTVAGAGAVAPRAAAAPAGGGVALPAVVVAVLHPPDTTDLRAVSLAGGDARALTTQSQAALLAVHGSEAVIDAPSKGLQLLDLRTGALSPVRGIDPGVRLAPVGLFSPDGTRLSVMAVVSSQPAEMVIDLAAGTSQVLPIAANLNATAVAWTDAGIMLLTSQGLEIIDPSNGNLVASSPPPRFHMLGAMVGPDTTMVAIAGHDDTIGGAEKTGTGSPTANTLWLLDAGTASLRQILQRPGHDMQPLAIGRDGSVVVDDRPPVEGAAGGSGFGFTVVHPDGSVALLAPYRQSAHLMDAVTLGDGRVAAAVETAYHPQTGQPVPTTIEIQLLSPDAPPAVLDTVTAVIVHILVAPG